MSDIKWLDSVEEQLKVMSLRSWTRKSQNQEKRRAKVQETSDHDQLLRQRKRKSRKLFPLSQPDK